MLIDSHCHLHELKNIIEDVVKRAKENNVQLMISNAVDPSSLNETLILQKRFPEIKAAFGIHPSNMLSMLEVEITGALSFIGSHLSHAVAVGEIGLDFKHAEIDEDKEKQISLFEKQLRFARQHHKPAIVHSRRAQKQCLDILEDEKIELALMHWFVADKKTRKRAFDLGYLMTVGPSILFDEDMQNMLSSIPVEFLLLETDSPVPFNGKPSEPSWMKDIYAKAAEVLGLDSSVLEAQLEENAKKLFHL
jgi:TatD DNase family protein